jgi:hypothetical protein
VVELLDAIRRRNELEASTAAGSTAAAAAAAAVRAAPLAARSKTDSRLLQQMRRGRSPGVGPGGSTAPAAAAGSSGSNAAAAAAGSNAPAGVAAVRPEKAIVFSQWTSMLDLLEVPLRKAGFVFRRLDGTMTVAARERAIADFESSPEVKLLALLQHCWHISHICYPADGASIVPSLLGCCPGVNSNVQQHRAEDVMSYLDVPHTQCR